MVALELETELTGGIHLGTKRERLLDPPALTSVVVVDHRGCVEHEIDSTWKRKSILRWNTVIFMAQRDSVTNDLHLPSNRLHRKSLIRTAITEHTRLVVRAIWIIRIEQIIIIVRMLALQSESLVLTTDLRHRVDPIRHHFFLFTTQLIPRARAARRTARHTVALSARLSAWQ